VKTTRTKIADINSVDKTHLRGQLLAHARSLTPRFGKPSEKSLAKIRVLEATVDYLNDKKNFEELNIVIANNPLWNDATGESYTKALVDAAMKLKDNIPIQKQKSSMFRK